MSTMTWAVFWLVSGCGGGGGAVEGDYTCIGTRSAPEPGLESSFTYVVKNPTDDRPFGDAQIQVFPEGMLDDGCAPPCQELQTDEDGLVELTLPEGWFAYRVIGEPADAEDRRMTTLEVGAVFPPDDEGFLNALFEDSMRKIFSFARGRPDHQLGKAVLRAVDCGGVPVENLHPRVFDMDGRELDDIVVAYLDKGEGFPGIGRSGTNRDGRAFLANLPEGDVRVELWGHDGGGVDERWACEVLPVEEGATTTARMRPLRADAPASCLSDAGVDVAQ